MFLIGQGRSTWLFPRMVPVCSDCTVPMVEAPAGGTDP